MLLSLSLYCFVRSFCSLPFACSVFLPLDFVAFISGDEFGSCDGNAIRYVGEGGNCFHQRPSGRGNRDAHSHRCRGAYLLTRLYITRVACFFFDLLLRRDPQNGISYPNIHGTLLNTPTATPLQSVCCPSTNLCECPSLPRLDRRSVLLVKFHCHQPVVPNSRVNSPFHPLFG